MSLLQFEEIPQEFCPCRVHLKLYITNCAYFLHKFVMFECTARVYCSLSKFYTSFAPEQYIYNCLSQIVPELKMSSKLMGKLSARVFSLGKSTQQDLIIAFSVPSGVLFRTASFKNNSPTRVHHINNSKIRWPGTLYEIARGFPV